MARYPEMLELITLTDAELLTLTSAYRALAERLPAPDTSSLRDPRSVSRTAVNVIYQTLEAYHMLCRDLPRGARSIPVPRGIAAAASVAVCAQLGDLVESCHPEMRADYHRNLVSLIERIG